VGNSELFDQLNVIIKLVSNDICLKQGPTQINWDVSALVEIDFVLEFVGEKASAKAQLYDIGIMTSAFKKILNLLKAQPFIHNHRYSIVAGL
jgi:hypothetical protein